MIDPKMREIMCDAYRLLEALERPVRTDDDEINLDWWRKARDLCGDFERKWRQEPYRKFVEDLASACYDWAYGAFQREEVRPSVDQQRFF